MQRITPQCIRSRLKYREEERHQIHFLSFDFDLQKLLNQWVYYSQEWHESFISPHQWERTNWVFYTSLMHLLCKLLIPSQCTVIPDIFIHELTVNSSEQYQELCLKAGMHTREDFQATEGNDNDKRFCNSHPMLFTDSRHKMLFQMQWRSWMETKLL